MGSAGRWGVSVTTWEPEVGESGRWRFGMRPAPGGGWVNLKDYLQLERELSEARRAFAYAVGDWVGGPAWVKEQLRIAREESE